MGSVGKSRDRQHCIRNEQQYEIRDVFTTRLCYNAMKIDFVWSDMANNLQLHSSWWWPLCRDSPPQDGSAGHGQWPSWQPVKIPSLCNRDEEEWRVETVFKLNWISNLNMISDWSVHSKRYLPFRLGPLRWVPIAHVGGDLFYSPQ